MKPNTNETSTDGPTVSIDVPVRDDRLFGSEALEALLVFFSRNPDQALTITDLAGAVDYSRPAVSRAVDVLSNNDLVRTERDGPGRNVSINRDRLHVPENPYFRIPQSEFHEPVQAATTELVDELADVVAVVLYGSVARGDADRRSDVDLWVLVEADRMDRQRRANGVRQRLEERAFDGDRYEYEIDVETLQAIPNYREDVRRILSEGIVVYEIDAFETVRSMVFEGTGEA